MKEADLEKLESIFQTVFNDQEVKLTRELSASDVANWDSFNHVNLIIAVESEFGIRLSPGEVGTMKNVGDLIDLIDDARS